MRMEEKQFKIAGVTVKNKHIVYGSIAFTALFLFRRIFSSDGSGSMKFEEAKNLSKVSLLSSAEARIYARHLYNAMADFGTTEKTVFNIIDSLSSADFLKVYNAFGAKRYFIGTRSEYLGCTLDLCEWLKAEVSSSEYSEIKERFPDLSNYFK